MSRAKPVQVPVRAMPFVQFVEEVLRDERGRRIQLSLGQRALCRVAFDGVDPADLEPAERAMAAQLLGPVDYIPPGARYVLCLVKGARIGGSYIFGALYSLWRALTADLSTLAPGERAVALIVAPQLGLARQLLRFAKGAVGSTPSIRPLLEEDRSDGFALRRSDGRLVNVECLPASRGGAAVRGRSLVSAVLSECAFFRDESAAVNDQDIFRAVNPRVLPGGMTVLESTPWVEGGLLHKLYSDNYGEPTAAIAVNAPTLVMLPTERNIAAEAAARQIDPDNADREFGAQFLGAGSGLFFGPELLRPALESGEPVRRSGFPGAEIHIGGDVGLVTDATAWAAVARRGEEFILCDLLERRPSKGAPLKLSEVVLEGCEFASRYGQREITVDHHELQSGREHLPDGYELTPCAGGAAAKEERFLRAREAFRQGHVRIPAELVKLTNQLSLVVAKPRPGGGTSIVLPRRSGTHMDLASAFILALDAAQTALRGEDSTNFSIPSNRGTRGRRSSLRALAQQQLERAFK